jgi:hypothetical protein
MVGDAVQDMPHPDGYWAFGDGFSDGIDAVGTGLNSLVHRLSHLSLINVKGSHDLDVTGKISPQVVVHQSQMILIRLVLPVVLDTLEDRGCAVSDTNNTDSDLSIAIHVPTIRYEYENEIETSATASQYIFLF